MGRFIFLNPLHPNRCGGFFYALAERLEWLYSQFPIFLIIQTDPNKSIKNLNIWVRIWVEKRGPPVRCRGPPKAWCILIEREKGWNILPISYFIFRRKKYAPEVGTYYSYDIVAYGLLHQGPVQILQDVSTDAELVFRMVMAFNRYSLSPLHLKDAVLDMLE